jgi:hypothetical protein
VKHYTSYSSKHQGKQWTVERLLVNVLHYLALHRCGLLIIEEAQEKNLAATQFAREFLTFFLRLLNHSIPVVIIGNPLAFSVLDSFSQDQSRFSEYGDFRIDPTFDFRDEEWRDVWMADLWTASLLDHSDEPIEDLSELIWNYTAGFPRHLARLRRETLSVAIQLGSARVSLEHIQIATASPAMSGASKLISAFVNRNWKELEQYDDIPIAEVKSKWDLLAASAQNPPNSPNDDDQTNTDEGAPEVSSAPVNTKPKRKSNSNSKKAKTAKKPPAARQKFDDQDCRSQAFLDKLNGNVR